MGGMAGRLGGLRRLVQHNRDGPEGDDLACAAE